MSRPEHKPKPLTALSLKLLHDNYKYIYTFVNGKYKNENKDMKSELCSQAYIEISNRMDKYDPKKGNFNFFMYNVLKFNLHNFYTRKVLGYTTSTNVNHMSGDELERKKAHEKKYNDDVKKYELDLVKFKEGNINTEPIIPTSYSFSVRYRPSVRNTVDVDDIDNHAVSCDDIDDLINTIDIKGIRGIRESIGCTNWRFFELVFYDDYSGKQAANIINDDIRRFITSIENKVNYLDSIGVGREHLKYDFDNTSNSIDKHILELLIYENMKIDDIYDRVKCLSWFFTYNKVLGIIKDKYHNKGGRK